MPDPDIIHPADLLAALATAVENREVDPSLCVKVLTEIATAFAMATQSLTHAEIPAEVLGRARVAHNTAVSLGALLVSLGEALPTPAPGPAATGPSIAPGEFDLGGGVVIDLDAGYLRRIDRNGGDGR